MKEPKKHLSSYALVPIFLLLYFGFCKIPRFIDGTRELFPVFSFSLYSRVPNGFSHYDILIDKGKETEHFLYHFNGTLNKLQKKSYKHFIQEISDGYEQTGKLDSKRLKAVLSRHKNAYLIRFHGDYVKAVRDGDYQLETIGRLK